MSGSFPPARVPADVAACTMGLLGLAWLVFSGWPHLEIPAWPSATLGVLALGLRRGPGRPGLRATAGIAGSLALLGALAELLLLGGLATALGRL